MIDILLFKLSTCGPCKLVGKHLSELNVNHRELVIDESDEADELADKYNIGAVPTIVILDKEGEELGRISGAKSKEEILAEIEKYQHDGNK